MRDRPLRLSVRRVDVGDDRRVGAAPWSVIARISEELTGFGPAAAGIEHRRRRLVGEQLRGRPQPIEQPLMNRAQQEGGPSDPVGQCRAIEVDALAGINLRLAIQRKVVGIFRHQHLGDRRLGRQAAFDQPRRRRRLHHDVFAGPAGVFGSAHHQHPELGRHDVEPLGDILADPMQLILSSRDRSCSQCRPAFRCAADGPVRRRGSPGAARRAPAARPELSPRSRPDRPPRPARPPPGPAGAVPRAGSRPGGRSDAAAAP